MSEDKHPLPFHQVRIKKLKSLLAIAENAVKGGDNHLFKNLYAEVDGKEKDILDDGSLSCAVFVSGILVFLELIKKPHASVYSTEKDLKESGWFEVKDLRPGAVVVWEKIKFEDGIKHTHIGFCVNNNEAVSNYTDDKFPRKHHITFNNTRNIEKIYWHSELDEG